MVDQQFSKEFIANMGKGRAKGSKNKKTRFFEDGYSEGYQKAMLELKTFYKPKNGKKPPVSKFSLDSFGDFDKFGDLGVKIAPILPLLAQLGAIPLAVGGLWLAEEWVKIPIKSKDKDGKEITTWVPFPQILHMLVGTMVELSTFLGKGVTEFAGAGSEFAEKRPWLVKQFTSFGVGNFQSRVF